MSKDIFIDNDSSTYQDPDGDVRTVEGKEATANRVRIAVKWELGEAKIDVTEGIDYIGTFQDRGADLSLLDSQIRSAALSVEAVERVKNVDLDFDALSRKLTYNITLIADEQEELNVKGEI